MILDSRPAGQHVARTVTPDWAVLTVVGVCVVLVFGGTAWAAGAQAAAVVAGAVLAVALVAATAWRPAIGCCVLGVGVPLTAGLGRGTVIPLLRTSEALTALVALGVLIHHIRTRRPQPYTLVDLAVFAYSVGGATVPALVLYLGRTSADQDTWRIVIAPVQYLVLFLLFSRAGLNRRELGWLLNLTMAASLLVAVVGLAQLADLPGVRQFITDHYLTGPGANVGICLYGVCRPTSLLEHWSSFGAYAVLNYGLALTLMLKQQRGYSVWWLTAVLIANGLAIIASGTQAAIVGAVVVTAIALWWARRVPRQLLVVALAVGIGLALFWPQIQPRLEQQLGSASGVSTQGPESLQTRQLYWSELFIPVLAEHPWFGTGTVIPAEIPPRLERFVDSEYLRMGFRAGAAGLVLLVLLLVALGAAGARRARSPDLQSATIGALVLAYVGALFVMGFTAEYLTYAGVSQQFWMVAGLLGAQLLPQAALRRAVILRPLPQPESAAAKAYVGSAVPGSTQRLAAPRALLHSSAVIFIGNSLARGLGLLFAIAAAHLLMPADYGLLAYSIAIANVGSILLLNASSGLSRFLPRHADQPAEQTAYFSNWLFFVTTMLGVSLLAAIPLGLVAGLGGWLLVGLMVNLVGVAAFETYRSAQRGLERFGPMVAFYVLAQVIQLCAIIVAGRLGLSNPALFFVIYGLSSVVALPIVQWLTPVGIRFDRFSIAWRRLVTISRFTWPLLLQTAFFSVWFGIDLILVKRLLSPGEAGDYAVAKTLVNVLLLAPQAIGSALSPRIARLPRRAARRYLLLALGLGSLIILPSLVAVSVLGKLVIATIFGAAKYPDAAEPLTILGAAMALYGFYLIVEAAVIALGRTRIDAIASACGMVTTTVAGLMLVPRMGLVGAAWAFAMGAAVQLVLIGIFLSLILNRRSLRPTE